MQASVRVRSRTWGALAPAVAVLLLGLPAPTALAQDVVPGASAFLSPDHWSHAALGRLDGAGLLSRGFDPGTRNVSRLEAFRRLEHAAAVAPDRAPAWTSLTEAYLARLREEFPHTAALTEPRTGGRGADAGVSGGFQSSRNGILARHQPDLEAESRTVSLGNAHRPTGGFDAGFVLPSNPVSAAAQGGVSVQGRNVRASEAYGVLQVRRLGIWAGRRELGFGSADGGSMVLGPRIPFDGAGVFLSDGVQLPSILGYLGSIRFEGFLSRLDRTGQVESPWFIGGRGSVAPHQRVRVGITRGVFFGGDGELVPPVTAARMLKVLVGIDTADEGAPNFENHTAAMDVWLAPPLGDLPLVLYGEWAVQDLQAQRTEMPGFSYGARVEGVPGASWLRVGLERTTFSQPFRNRRPWYDHRVFGTWTDGGRLLGHPLGGVGREFRVYGNADLVDARLRMEGRLHTRRRTGDNLLAPERQGSSHGVEGLLRWRLNPAVELQVRSELERGDDWNAGSASVGARFRF